MESYDKTISYIFINMEYIFCSKNNLQVIIIILFILGLLRLPQSLLVFRHVIYIIFHIILKFEQVLISLRNIIANQQKSLFL